MYGNGERNGHTERPSDEWEGKGSGKAYTRTGGTPSGSGARQNHRKRNDGGKEGGGEDIFDDGDADPIIARVVLRNVSAEVGAAESWDSDVYYGSLAEVKHVTR